MTTTADLPAATMADLDRICALSATVQWPHRREDIRLLLGLGQGRMVLDGTGGPGLGVGMWWPIGDDLARLGMIIVDPACQGRGLGQRLVKALLADAGARSVMLLATALGRPLYEKLGFVPVDANIQHQGMYDGVPIADRRLRPATVDDIAGIVALDAPAFGTRREAHLTALLAAGCGVVLDRKGQIEGYAMERAFGRGSLVGPIVAGSQEDAAVLFRYLARPGFVRVDRPADALTFGRHLQFCGLPALDGVSPVMALGNWPAATGPAQIYGLAGHAIG